jgi:hypothetical protein
VAASGEFACFRLKREPVLISRLPPSKAHDRRGEREARAWLAESELRCSSLAPRRGCSLSQRLASQQIGHIARSNGQTKHQSRLPLQKPNTSIRAALRQPIVHGSAGRRRPPVPSVPVALPMQLLCPHIRVVGGGVRTVLMRASEWWRCSALFTAQGSGRAEVAAARNELRLRQRRGCRGRGEEGARRRRKLLAFCYLQMAAEASKMHMTTLSPSSLPALEQRACN